ncbi:MAG: hypothetical protein HYY41_07140 [Chloroflexi bacterium]|nr:hypothetical protein [Chloroflexota bacterium]
MVTEFGYTGKILRVDLSTGSMTDIPTAKYADRFLGGRGIAAKIYWDEVSPEVGALEPENRLIFIIGPLAGLPGLAGSRWQVCGKSPATAPEHFCYSGCGGSWGAYLKFAGYDGIVVQGKSDRPVYLFLHDGIPEIRGASPLWGKPADEVRAALKNELGSATRVVATGPAGENMVIFASLLADNDATGGSGFGAVMGSKNLKAIAVSGSRKVPVADPERLRELSRYIRELKRDSTPEWETSAGSKRKKELCYGCIKGCNRSIYQADDGKQGKFMCQSASFYSSWADRYYQKRNDVPFWATKLCDYYGLDTKAITPMLTWLSRCRQTGLLTDENTGLPMSKLGSLEFIEALVKKVSFRDGFGDILAQGTFKAAELMGGKAKEQIGDFPFKAGQRMTYGPRMYIATGLLYMVEPRPPVPELHEISHLVVDWVEWVKKKKDASLSSDGLRSIAEKFWGSALAADFSTYEGKALAAKIIQERQYAKESLILCDFSWPMAYIRDEKGQVGNPGLESKIVSAVIGKELDEQGLYQVGERVLNLQRAILAREGHRGRENDLLPEPCYAVPLDSDSRNPECLVPSYRLANNGQTG